MNIYLGIDIGTSGTKTLAIQADGTILARATAFYPCFVPQPLWSEQNPDDWFAAVIKTVRQVLEQGKIAKEDVKAIGLSGQMHGSVFLDKNHKVIRNAILWNDQRTVKECEEIERLAGGRDSLISMVANPAMTGFTAPKILWLRNKEPENYEKLSKVLLPKDEIRRRLTGEFATEVSDASGMLLLDVAHRQWSQPLLSALQLDKNLLATVYESEEITGNLTKEAAELLGLTTNCQVVGGAGDCAAGAVGNGIVRSGILSTSIGTSGVMFIHSDEMKLDQQGRVHTFCHAVHGKWHMMGVNLSSGGSLQWFRNNLCDSLLEEAKKQNRDVYELMTAEAEKTPVGAEGLFFLPYLSGERTPHADPNARGAFIGLTLAHARGHLIRSIMEGVTFSMRDSLEIFRSLNVPVEEIRAGGGGSRSPFWRQMQADVFGQRVSTLNSDEGAAFGAALLATVGGGEYQNIEDACQVAVSTVQTVSPIPENQKIYQKSFPIYQQLYRSLKNDFQTIAQL
ncbi:MAG: xylulokinase [Planctomycetia bacterium]|nr:xylulokinase [Planctomycetia bacterium]